VENAAQERRALLGIMQQLHTLGVATSLDDFGTGYSSINYLRKFPFDKIKVDQSFTRDVAGEPEASSRRSPASAPR
jgi:EAL domain-containing protein (putative c-di-GMP-specific phosphodiesterase class I)